VNGRASKYEFSVILPNGVEKRVRVNVFPRFQNKKVVGVYGIFENISETGETQQRWQTFIEQSPLPVVVFVDRKFAFANESAAKFHGLNDPKELIGQDLLAFSTTEDKKVMLERFEQIENNEVLEPRETEIVTKTGVKKRVIVHPKRIKFQGKDAIESVIFDITDIKNEQHLISKSLAEKEILLKEIHHRVKNNLAIISGLIELQIQTAKDHDPVDVLRDSQNRIQSIALVHQQLYQFESFSQIELASYLRDLIDGLEYTFVRSNDIEFHIESEEIKISIENAIPCSLIVNEVIINAFKHAFNNTIDPKVDISIKNVNDQVELSVCDNGVGIGKILPSPSKPSLGTTLIDILTQQLQGTSHYFEGPSKGTCFKLTFPIQ
jgi:PAS domain S-box-containing protein